MTHSPADDPKRGENDEAESGDTAQSDAAEVTGADEVSDADGTVDGAVEETAAIEGADIAELMDDNAVEDQRSADDNPQDIAALEDADAGSSGTSFSGMALQLLIMILVIFGLSLWLVPMVAPHLPASIAKHIMPGQQQLDQRLAALDEEVRAETMGALAQVKEMREEIDSLTKRLAAAEAATAAAVSDARSASSAAQEAARTATTASVADDVVTAAQAAATEAAEAAETATTAATSAGKVAAAATRDTASLARQMTDFEARLASFSEQIGALGEGLAATPSDDGNPTQELAAAFAALKARVDGLGAQIRGDGAVLTQDDANRFATQDDLRSARTALSAEVEKRFDALPAPDEIATATDLESLQNSVDERIGGMATQIEQAAQDATSAAAAAGAAKEASNAALRRVDGAIRDASLRSAIASLTSRMQNGATFAHALEEIENLTSQAPPEALVSAANTGLATTDTLLRKFSRSAQNAVAADIEAASSDEGILGKAAARLESVVAGRPKSEQQGDTTDAILSRIEARLRDGSLSGALAEAETLNAAAKEGLGTWMDDLTTRVTADTAASDYIASLSTDQG